MEISLLPVEVESISGAVVHEKILKDFIKRSVKMLSPIVAPPDLQGPWF
jgi:hypothetical protein